MSPRSSHSTGPNGDKQPASARERLHRCWSRLGELSESRPEDLDQEIRKALSDRHRAALDSLIESREISAQAASIVHAAYQAAVDHHSPRSSSSVMCYRVVVVDEQHEQASPGRLIEQIGILNQVAAQGTVKPSTLAKARTALEHELSFYTPANAKGKDLYERLREAKTGSFEDLLLEQTPEIKAAAQFLMDLLTRK